MSISESGIARVGVALLRLVKPYIDTATASGKPVVVRLELTVYPDLVIDIKLVD